jgi:hypothetical protein
MSKKFIFIGVLILCFILLRDISCCEETIWPTANFSANFCNFPQAWSISKGKNVNVGIIYADSERNIDWRKIVAYLAPEAEVDKVDLSQFLNLSSELLKYQILLLLKEIEKNQFQQVRKLIEFFVEKGVTIILPSYFGPMKAGYDYTSWRKFIKDASQAGAVIVGVHGRAYQLGSLSFWKSVPVDIFALHNSVDGDNYFKPSAMIDRPLEWSAYLAAAAVVLLKSKEPQLSPEKIKQVFKHRGRRLIWAYIQEESGWVRVSPYLNKEALNNYLRENEEYKPKVVDVFEGNTLDAALLLGLPPMKDGDWSFNVLNVAPAQRFATGKGVTVAILDHLFDRENPALKGRIVKPGSVVEGAPVFTGDGHGTWMARDLVRVAPGVKIMPVRICGKSRYQYTDLYIKGIEYAVENGADIISLSHRAVPEEKQEILDKAIEKASQKGVTFVYIHYYGDRKDVVLPGPIEFARGDAGKEYFYVVGTNFINESSFPYTWGLSQTAPIVSGVIALMKEINPKLKPLKIKKILLKSTNLNPDGYPLLDALKAVKNID